MIRGGALLLEQEGDDGWEKVHILISSDSPATAQRWESYGLAGRFAVTLVAHRGTKPLYVRLPPVAPGDYRFRLDLVHSNHELGDVRARTATLYAPMRGDPGERAEGLTGSWRLSA